MRRLIRWVDEEGRVSLGVEPLKDGVFHAILGTDDPMRLLQGESFPVEQAPVPLEDEVSLELGGGRTLLMPWDPPEVWCAGVTYRRSRDARMAESAVQDVYDLVYEANRPELFLKDAGCRRTVGPLEPIGIRGDSVWNVPEPEIGLVVGERGRILAYTIGNDVSSREIEGANPLYLSQAKVFAGACAVGPSLYVPRYEPQAFQIVIRVTAEDGSIAYEDRTTTASMVRTFKELVGWLVKENPVPPGTLLLTGTGLVPGDDFTLLPGQWVEIHVPEVGTLVNPVAHASELSTGRFT
jgi:2-dehydro-3-deoxy-D-arabinonate dehydratase